MLAKLLKPCSTLWDLMDCRPSGSSVHGISRQEYWGELPCPAPGDLPDPGTEPLSPESPRSQAHPLPTEPPKYIPIK